jgi:hypothetical protein
MQKDNPDRTIWIDSYLEEAGGLKEQNAYSVLAGKEYSATYGHVQVIPLMRIQMV